MNRHVIGVQGDRVVVVIPIVGRMTPREAVEAGAWLQAMAGVLDPDLDVDAIRREVIGS